MRLAADTSALIRLYVDQGEAATITRFLAEDAKVVSVSELARIETLNVLLRGATSGAATKFEEDLAEGVRLRLESVDWLDAFRRAESLGQAFRTEATSRRTRPRPGGGGGRNGRQLVSFVRSQFTPAPARQRCWVARVAAARQGRKGMGEICNIGPAVKIAPPPHTERRIGSARLRSPIII